MLSNILLVVRNTKSALESHGVAGKRNGFVFQVKKGPIISSQWNLGFGGIINDHGLQVTLIANMTPVG
jgi:hypothetical protein